MIGVIRKALLAASFPPSDHSRMASCFSVIRRRKLIGNVNSPTSGSWEGASYINPSDLRRSRSILMTTSVQRKNSRREGPEDRDVR